MAMTAEDLGEQWRCREASTAAGAYGMMAAHPPQAALLAASPEAALLWRTMKAQPLLSPPYLLGVGFPAADGTLQDVGDLPCLLHSWRAEGRLPALHLLRLEEAADLAQGLLTALRIPPKLRAWGFLPDLIGLTTVHPPLLCDMAHGLYPLIARRHGLTPAAVERSLRLCIEATWTRGDLAAIDRFFGSSVDPDRGKPTNREFICRVQERVTLAARRLGQ